MSLASAIPIAEASRGIIDLIWEALAGRERPLSLILSHKGRGKLNSHSLPAEAGKPGQSPLIKEIGAI
jgi:hypothetical protein